MTHNLTGARLAEQQLRSLLASIVETSDDAIVSKNLAGVITSWNRGAERVFGYSAGEVVGQPITIVIPEDRQSEEREILTRVGRGERIDHYETVRQRKDGSLIVVSLTVSPVKSAEGKIVGASKIARDITEQRRGQEQIATLAREATVGQLSASIAHEIRQPLAGILASAQAALRWLEKANVEEVRENLNGIVSDGQRANDIIKNLRAMFKHDVQEKILVDINGLVLSVVALVVIDLQKHKIELRMQLDDRNPETLGNQVQLQQVILNLVMNAIESMSSLQTRVLRIKTELGQSSTVHVSVEDTGTGIKPSDVTRLFQPMFTTKARGMGMGLSICKSIIENHDGRIRVSQGANGGSIFQFELPTIANKDRSGSVLSEMSAYDPKQYLHRSTQTK
jgi:two-component system sensor kinase FixL